MKKPSISHMRRLTLTLHLILIVYGKYIHHMSDFGHIACSCGNTIIYIYMRMCVYTGCMGREGEEAW